MANEEKIEFDVMLDLNNKTLKAEQKFMDKQLKINLPIIKEIIQFYIKYDTEQLKEFMLNRLSEWYIANPKLANKVIEQEYDSIIDYMIDKDYETQNSLGK